jgi:hypothetical protein
VNRSTSKPMTRTPMTLRVAAIATTVFALAVPALAAPAGAATGGTRTAPNVAQQCKGAPIKPIVHADAVRRTSTLANLVTRLRTNKDPYGLNGPQISALQTASGGIAALDGQIAGTCYPSTAALKADAQKLFVDYRVYWLRGPQTAAIRAADALAGARVRLARVAAKAAPLVGSNANAQADLAAMNSALATADAKLGTPPNPAAAIAAAAGLQPAADMTNDTAVLESAHADLLAAKAALAAARASGLAVLNDLQG